MERSQIPSASETASLSDLIFNKNPTKNGANGHAVTISNAEKLLVLLEQYADEKSLEWENVRAAFRASGRKYDREWNAMTKAKKVQYDASRAIIDKTPIHIASKNQNGEIEFDVDLHRALPIIKEFKHLIISSTNDAGHFFVTDGDLSKFSNPEYVWEKRSGYNLVFLDRKFFTGEQFAKACEPMLERETPPETAKANEIQQMERD